MTCENIPSLFVHYLAGKLDSEQQQRVEQHLETCLHCQAELSLDRKLIGALSSNRNIPALSSDFNQSVLSKAAALKQPYWHKVITLGFEQPWIVSTLGMIFSFLLTLGYAAWKTLGADVDFFLALFPFVPWIIGLVLLVTFGIIYVNEKFIDKLVYSSLENTRPTTPPRFSYSDAPARNSGCRYRTLSEETLSRIRGAE